MFDVYKCNGTLDRSIKTYKVGPLQGPPPTSLETVDAEEDDHDVDDCGKGLAERGRPTGGLTGGTPRPSHGRTDRGNAEAAPREERLRERQGRARRRGSSDVVGGEQGGRPRRRSHIGARLATFKTVYGTRCLLRARFLGGNIWPNV